MKARCSVTFEFDKRPPLTWRGETAAGSAHTLVAKAVKAAKRELRPINWQSLVAVVLERLDEGEETDHGEADA